ncbi:hypothetical protein KUI_0107 [Taylorella equigenitalis ATCC 35865]|uniref:Uncharacterized protein n=1 Tax=Taylorella equigenitalis ATCC 35865 TaxID=743973 RepID=A0ABM5N8G5_9BURK|nr:hypothetical protein KUI_0107 [Taylorella equigenitalis ATCC 35865]
MRGFRSLLFGGPSFLMNLKPCSSLTLLSLESVQDIRTKSLIT